VSARTRGGKTDLEVLVHREIAILGAYLPAMVPLCVLGATLTWIVDRMLAAVGLYRVVWHPALFRASLLVIVCCAFGLAVYR
jgi:protein AaeX